MTGLEAADGSEEPIALLATTVNVYAVPFVKPFTYEGEEYDVTPPPGFPDIV